MFERIIAYKNLKKSNEFLKGCKAFAESTGNEKLLKDVNETLYLNEILKREMWYNRKLAIMYNLDTIRNGL